MNRAASEPSSSKFSACGPTHSVMTFPTLARSRSVFGWKAAVCASSRAGGVIDNCYASGEAAKWEGGGRNRNGCAFAHCPRLPTAKYAELPEHYVSRFTLGRVKNSAHRRRRRRCGQDLRVHDAELSRVALVCRAGHSGRTPGSALNPRPWVRHPARSSGADHRDGGGSSSPPRRSSPSRTDGRDRASRRAGCRRSRHKSRA